MRSRFSRIEQGFEFIGDWKVNFKVRSSSIVLGGYAYVYVNMPIFPSHESLSGCCVWVGVAQFLCMDTFPAIEVCSPYSSIDRTDLSPQ